MHSSARQPWQIQVAACALCAVCGQGRRQVGHEKLRGLHLGTGRAVPSFGVIELMGQQVAIHCAAKGRLLNHRFMVAPLDMEARAKGEGGGTGFA